MLANLVTIALSFLLDVWTVKRTELNLDGNCYFGHFIMNLNRNSHAYIRFGAVRKLTSWVRAESWPSKGFTLPKMASPETVKLLILVS